MGRFSLRSRQNEKKTWPIQKKGSFPRVGARRRDAARLPSAHELGGSKTSMVYVLSATKAAFISQQLILSIGNSRGPSVDISPIVLAAKVTKIG